MWTIALREYKAMVATKAFLLSITLMPVLMFGGLVAASRLQDVRDLGDKTIVIVDGTDGTLYRDLERSVETHNAVMERAESRSTDGTISTSTSPTPKYRLRRHPQSALDDAARLALSDQVRQGEMEAFIEVPPGLLEIERSAPAVVEYHGQNAMLSPDRQWFDRKINEAVVEHRLDALKLDPFAVRQATSPVRVAPLGLYKEAPDGSARSAAENQNLAAMFVPFGFMMLMFMVIMMSAQPLLESVMEEKAGRIAEVLLGSASAFQLMLGKLLGNVAGSLSVVALYAIGGYLLAARSGWTDFVPLHLLPWFVAFQVLAVLLYGSIFMAVGASVTQLKEAQTMLLPLWLIMMCPLFVWLQMVREPNGSIAMWISFFPPAAPLAMVVRLASDTVIPVWQPILALALLVVTTLGCVWLAGRVFRIGILWQGKTPQLRELARWALRG